MDAGIGDVVAVNGIIGGHIIEAHDAAEDHRFGVRLRRRFSRLPSMTMLRLGQHVDDARGDIGDDGFGVIDGPAAVVFVVGVERDAAMIFPGSAGCWRRGCKGTT